MKLAQDHNVEFISIKENFDTTSAMGKAMVRIAMIFAQLEREQNSERVLDIMTYRAARGLFNGGIPSYGYVSANKELIPYPKEKQIVEFIFNKFIQIKSITEIARFLNESDMLYRHSKLWDKRCVSRILQNPIYTGKVFWKGELYEGIHQPIITNQVFEETQAIFRKRKCLWEKSSIRAMLQKLLYCGYCGSPMSPTYALNKIKKRYYYYACTSTRSAEKGTSKCRYKYAAFNTLEPKLIQLLLSLPEEYHLKPIELKVHRHNETIQQKQTELQAQITTAEAQQTAIKTKKEKYLDSLITRPFRSTERQLISAKIQELDQEEKQIKSQLYKLHFDHTQTTDEQVNLTDLKQTLITFKANHETYTHDQLKEFLATHIKEITYHPEKLAIHFNGLPWSLDFSV